MAFTKSWSQCFLSVVAAAAPESSVQAFFAEVNQNRATVPVLINVDGESLALGVCLA